MTTLLTPISIQVPLVDPTTGQPTPYFQRLLQQLLKEKAVTDELAEAAVQDSRLINSGAGLTGGGDLSADRTLDVGAGTGIVVNANDVAIDSTYLDERIRDVIGAALTAGSNVTITVNDGSDTITIAASGGGGGGGGFTLLEQYTAAASASLNFTTSISSTYDEYLIEFVNVIPVTNAVNLYMRMSTNAGVSYDSGANYGSMNAATNRFGQSQSGSDSGANQISLNNNGIDNIVVNGGVSGTLRLFSPLSTSLHKHVLGTFAQTSSSFYQSVQIAGAYRSTTAVNAFQFFFSSGNISSGTIRVYGVPK
jgi:hypothetical protein